MTPTPIVTAPTPRRPGPRRWTALAATLTVALATTVTACGITDTAQTTSSSSPAAPTATLTTLDGAPVTIPGSKPAALFFFSVGCGACVGGATSLAQSATAVGDKADFLAVDMDPRESPETVRGFLDHIKAPQLPATIDTGAALSRRFQVAALSTLIVIDPRGGKVTYRATDPTADQIKAELAKVGAQ